jgi:transcriptional regulator with XRE-family HTH domain
MENLLNKERIGDRIRKLRVALNMTQAELAAKLNLTDKAISKWESGEGDPNIDVLPDLAELLGVTTDYLLTGKKPQGVSGATRLETAAREDDPSILEKIESDGGAKVDSETSDETGRILIEYVYKYDSKKVFGWLSRNQRLRNCGRGYPFNNRGEFKKLDEGLSNYVYMLILAGVWKQSRWPNGATLRDLAYVGAEKYFGASAPRENCLLDDYFLERVASPSFANKESLKDAIGDGSRSWFAINPWLLEKAYLLGNRELAFFIAETYISIVNGVGPNVRGNVESRNCLGGKGLAWVTETAFRKALADDDEEAIAKFTEMNKAVRSGRCETFLPDEYDLRMARVSHDASLSKEEKIFQSVTHDGYIRISDLVKLGDFDLYKKGLERPVCALEEMWRLCKAGDQKAADEFAASHKMAPAPKVGDIEAVADFLLKEGSGWVDNFHNVTGEVAKNLAPNIGRYDVFPHLGYGGMGASFEKTAAGIDGFFRRKESLTFDEIWALSDFRFYQEAIEWDNKKLDAVLEKAVKEKPSDYRLQKLLLDKGAKLHHRWVENPGDDYESDHDDIDEVSTQLLKNQIELFMRDAK